MISSRDRILNKLKKYANGNIPEKDQSSINHAVDSASLEDPLAHFKGLMRASHTEIHQCTDSSLLNTLADLIARKGYKRVLLGESMFRGLDKELVDSEVLMERYKSNIETFKPAMFNHIEVGITHTEGAIADSGALVLHPTEQEPRLLSLVPPIHIAVLKASQLYASMEDYIKTNITNGKMPTNLLFISGPSKTADIQQTLAYGAHGPKELIVVIVN